MGVFDIVVIVLVSAAFVAAVGHIIYRRLKHKGGCDCCDCSGCGTCSCCCNKNEEKKEGEGR